jgi:hypothetical protein
MKTTDIFVRDSLPLYIREDSSYDVFIEFLQDYYKWFDENYKLHNLDEWIDVDTTFDDFLYFFQEEFLPSFPKNIYTDKKKLLKIAKVFFENKGTPDSFNFLFKALFNSDVELQLTNEFVLIASGGKWVAPKSVKIKSVDPIWLTVNNYKLFGETSKSYAVIESAKYSAKFIQLYLSNIIRLFQSGETIFVLDGKNKYVYVLNGEIVEYDSTPPEGAEKLTTKIVGALSSVKVNSKYRGQFYTVGDPVIIYGGLNPAVENPIPALAEVESTTVGGLKDIIVLDGGYGYAEYPNSQISFYSSGVPVTTANAYVSLVDRTQQVNVSIYTTLISAYANTVINANTYGFLYPNLTGKIISSNVSNTITGSNTAFTSELKVGIQIYNTSNTYIGTISNIVNNNTLYLTTNAAITTSNINFTKLSTYETDWSMALVANANTRLENALYSETFPVFPVKEITISETGYGFTAAPETKIETLLHLQNDVELSLSNFGILAPIKIIEGGTNYQVNNVIAFSGGTGFGAKAVVSSVDGTGKITGISYIQDTSYDFPVGGFGYSVDYLPTVSVVSGTGANAEISVPGILSSGAVLQAVTDNIGEITTIKLTENGEDYLSTPNVSIRVQDILIGNANNISIYDTGYCIAYQGTYSSPTYSAKISTYELIDSANVLTITDDVYKLRVFDYKGTLSSNTALKIYNTASSQQIDTLTIQTSYVYPNFTNGIRKYGDGNAKGSAKFLNGIIQDNGFYLNKQSLLSEISVLESENYNRQSYILSVDSSLSDYKESIRSLVHPAGTNILTRNLIKSNTTHLANTTSNTNIGSIIYANYVINGSANGYSNTIYVSGYAFNIANTFLPNSYITLTTNTYTVTAEILSSNNSSNTITTKEYMFVGKSNTALAYQSTILNII